MKLKYIVYYGSYENYREEIECEEKDLKKELAKIVNNVSFFCLYSENKVTDRNFKLMPREDDLPLTWSYYEFFIKKSYSKEFERHQMLVSKQWY